MSPDPFTYTEHKDKKPGHYEPIARARSMKGELTYRQASRILKKEDLEFFIGKKREKCVDLDPSTNVKLLDLEDFERLVYREVDLLCKNKRLSALDIVRRTVSVRSRASIHKSHDLLSFNLAESQRLGRMIEGVREEHPRSRIELVWGIETVAPITKRSRAQSFDDGSSLPSTPPTGTSKRRRRTEDLEDEARARKKAKKEIREDKIAYAGDHEAQLMELLTCRDKDCPNMDNYCWADPSDSKRHFSVSHLHQKSWANDIVANKATVLAPPPLLVLYWTTQQGPVTRDSRTSTRKTVQQQTVAKLDQVLTRNE